MELPIAAQRSKYIALAEGIDADLKAAIINKEVPAPRLAILQKRLDALADTYQENEKIGPALYKLYELQAFISYFGHKDEEALDFIQQAEQVRGANYARAEQLKQTLLRRNSPTPLTSQKPPLTAAPLSSPDAKLRGIGGWLALFVVGLFISAAITLFNFFNDGFLSSSEIDDINAYQSGLGDTLQQLTTFESITLVVYLGILVATIVLILQKRKVARVFAIITLVFGALYTTVDYALASSLFDSSGLTQYVQPVLSKASGDTGKTILGAAIWIPYFIVSKRVKATLTKV